MLIDEYLEKTKSFKKKKNIIDVARKHTAFLRRMSKTLNVSAKYSLVMCFFVGLYFFFLSYCIEGFGMHYIRTENQLTFINSMNDLSLTLKTISVSYILFLLSLSVYLLIKFLKKIKSYYNRSFIKSVTIFSFFSMLFLFSFLNLSIMPELAIPFYFITVNLFIILMIGSTTILIVSYIFMFVSFINHKLEDKAPTDSKSLIEYRNEVRNHKKLKNKYIENIHSSIEEMRYIKELKRGDNLDKEDLLEILLIENSFENKNKERYDLFLEEAVLKEQSLIENY